jgi:8-oxo-dGTP pyrophosphatase MutT (NUDIX family)
MDGGSPGGRALSQPRGNLGKYRRKRRAANVLWVPSPDSPAPAELRPVQRTAAYAVVTDGADDVLLVRASSRSDLRGRWFLPGGGLRHGEHPRDAALRELAEETGLRAAQATPREATADVIDLPHRGVSVHTLRLIYDVRFADLILDPEADPEAGPGSSAATSWPACR